MNMDKLISQVTDRIVAGETVPVKREYQGAVAAKLDARGIVKFEQKPKSDDPDKILFSFKRKEEEAA